MLSTKIKKIIKPLSLLSFAAASVFLVNVSLATDNDKKTQSYIISANNYQLLETTIREFKVEPSHKLPIINALAVNLTDKQLQQLQSKIPVKVTENYKVELNGNGWGGGHWQPKAVVPNSIDASEAHDDYNFGGGVTIGFLDTGLEQLAGLSRDLYGRDKAWGTYDAINNTVSNYGDEASGHGTHVASIAANADYDIYGNIYGVAPNAALVGIKAFDAEGEATYADVIRGIDWALQVKDDINLRVLNMSFSGPARSYYWEDPLNQAVMKAWQAGIVVVASAGNQGPEPMSIGVPGNVPYIITVGAMTDNYTESDTSDDKLGTFSAAGPTFEGFVKPEIVAPGGHITGLMPYNSRIAIEHPEFHDGGRYFSMSGTSQAAGVVSGVVALLLTDEPSLTPDAVKCRLMDSAHAAFDDAGELAYSVFQQGSGLVNVADALNSTATECANQALDIAQDVEGHQHFSGPANINEDGNFYIEGLGDEYVWNLDESNLGTNDLLWRPTVAENSTWQNIATTDSLIWPSTIANIDALNENVSFDLETNDLLWRPTVANSLTVISVNNWVEQE